jgi:hypothetical protein
MSRDEAHERIIGCVIVLILFIAAIINIDSIIPSRPKQGQGQELQTMQQLNARLDDLDTRCTQLEQQNIETLKRWKDIEGSYKAMYSIFNNQFGSDDK